MFVQQGPKLFFECHLAMMNFLARNKGDNRLAHLAPFEGVRLIGSFPGLKPRAESLCPFGVENPLQKSNPTPKILKLMLMGSCRILRYFH
jgi:hypothetical protein